MDIQTRPATNEDGIWLYKLYRLTLYDAIDRTWGWNDEFQEKAFNDQLHPLKFQVIEQNSNTIGAYLVTEKPDHYWLEMLLICSQYQQQGYGRATMKKLQLIAEQKAMPLKLSVIKANPVMDFYLRLGFKVYDQSDEFFELSWNANK